MKNALIILIILLAGLGGYIVLQGPSSDEVQTNGTQANNPSQSPTPKNGTTKWNTYLNTDDVNRPFQGYAFDYPPDWVIHLGSYLGEEKYQPYVPNSNFESIELTKGYYRLNFFRTEGGSGACIMSDSNKEPEGMDIDLRKSSFVQIETPIGVLRRVILNDNPQQPLGIVCVESLENSFVSGAGAFGGINYYLPDKYENALLTEMDSIVKTLRQMK